VASDYADCIGVAPQKCLLVKEEGSSDWQYLYTSIEGFNYEPGYEYIIDVRKEKVENVPADGSSLKYVLVKEIAKTPKKSDESLRRIPKYEKYYQAVGRVLSLKTENRENKKLKIVKLQVSSSTIDGIAEGDTIHVELIPYPRVSPVLGREYVFKGRNVFQNELKDTYLLDTDVLDLTR